MNNKKLLITGARGMLGSVLLNKLSSHYTCTGIDIADADITNKEQIADIILSSNPSIVIHTAAYTQVDNCEKEIELAYAVNKTGTANIATACTPCRAKLIYISTDYVFDGGKNSPYTEEDPVNPLNIYGKSKLAGEKEVRSTCPNHLIIRTSWLFGPNGNNFVTTINNLAEKQNEIKVVNDQTGNPTYTKDLAEAIKTILQKNTAGIINITNSHPCTWYDLAKKIIEITGKKTKITPITTPETTRPAQRPYYSALSTEKYTKITGIKIRSWERALQEYLKTA